MNNNFKIEKNDLLNETIFKTTLENGMQVFIANKKNFNKKILMFGTKYGSLINEFVDINTNEKVKVFDGVAHFLEHKLFECEEANALTLFGKFGMETNAWTSFDHTVYYFETVDNYLKGMELLTKLVFEPYFTDENTEKEKGIINEEIAMYEDKPSMVSYENLLKGLYHKNNVRIDILGTRESISNITKETLYTCYNTFYNPKNMFFIAVGDFENEEVIEVLNSCLLKYNFKKIDKIETFHEEEPNEIFEKFILKEKDVYMQNISIGHKFKIDENHTGDQIIKNTILSEIIFYMYFSKFSKFYEEEYNKGLIFEEINFFYEGTKTFSHNVIMCETKNYELLLNDIKEYLKRIQNEKIDSELFEIIKKKQIGTSILNSDNLNVLNRKIIEAILNDTDVYKSYEILESINEQDVLDYLNNLNDENMVVSVVKNKD